MSQSSSALHSSSSPIVHAQLVQQYNFPFVFFLQQHGLLLLQLPALASPTAVSVDGVKVNERSMTFAKNAKRTIFKKSDARLRLLAPPPHIIMSTSLSDIGLNNHLNETSVSRGCRSSFTQAFSSPFINHQQSSSFVHCFSALNSHSSSQSTQQKEPLETDFIQQQ